MKISGTGRKIGWRTLAVALACLAGGGGLFAAKAIDAAPPAKPARPAYLAAFPNFAPKLTPQMPGDVDIALKKELEKVQKFSEVQREFDLYSWQMFLALNWPTNGQGVAAPKLTDTKFGQPHWTLWHNSSSIFQTDGARPAACGVSPKARTLTLVRGDLAKPVSQGLAPFSAQAVKADPRGTRFLGVLSAVGELNAANLGDEIDQAFSGPMIDQNGEFVYYEIMIDPNEVGYICDNGLYNINGQVAFSKAGSKVAMPIGTPGKDWSGAFELKFAWKILKPGKDDFSRFHTSPAVIMDQGPDGKQLERKVTVGLVGMHIGHKSTTSPQWIWSTFEQVDNLDVDSVAHPKLEPVVRRSQLPDVRRQPAAAEGEGGLSAHPDPGLARYSHPRRQGRPEPPGPGGPEGPGLGLAVLPADRHPVAHRSDGGAGAVERRPAQRHRQQTGRRPDPGVPDQHHHGNLLPEGQPGGVQRRGTAQRPGLPRLGARPSRRSGTRCSTTRASR